MADQSSPVEVKAADGVLYVIVDPDTPIEDVRDMLKVGGVMVACRGCSWGVDEEPRTPDGLLSY